MSESFIENPAEYFGFDNYAAHQLPRVEVEKQQIATLNDRLASLKDKITPLGILAAEEGIESLENLEDIVPLLFPHSLYKSYPEELLMTGQYDKMTEWISRLTSVDLSTFSEQNYQTMDDWMDALDDQTDLAILHSSGTTGRMSFFPRGKAEIKTRHALFKMQINDQLDAPYRLGDRPNAVIWTAQMGGRTALLRGLPLLVDNIVENDDAFFPLIPAVVSSDHHYFVLQCKNLLEQGIQAAPDPSDYVRMRVEEAIQIHNDMPMLQDRLLDTIAALKYKTHVSFLGAPMSLHNLAKVGLDRGMENMFKPGSYVSLSGGLKDLAAPGTLQEDIFRFSGPNMISRDVYAMTELCSSFESCTQGHFHIPPWVIAYVLDAKTGQALPREGRQKGRAAFFDLIVSTYWGGVITGDMIEVDWGSCRCGRNTPFILPNIKRIQVETGNESFLGRKKKIWTTLAKAMAEGLSSSD